MEDDECQSSTQVRSLVTLCIHALSGHLQDGIVYLTNECKQKLLEVCASHRLLADPSCVSFLCLPRFGLNLSTIRFFASDDVTDEVLSALVEYNKNITRICIVDCGEITDKGIRSLTCDQSGLESLELRSMKSITEEAFSLLRSEHLHTVDISGCSGIKCLRPLLSWNRRIRRLCINSCNGLEDQTFYDIAFYLADSLIVLEMDFFHRLSNPIETLTHVSTRCTRLASLSLIRFFHQDVMDEEPFDIARDCHLDKLHLRSVDLYENYFTHLPLLPSTIQTLSISLSGDEDLPSIISTFSAPHLSSISIKLCTKDDSANALNNANRLLCSIAQTVGDKIVSIQIALFHIYDDTLHAITEKLCNLKHLVIRCVHMNHRTLQRYFTMGANGCRLRTLKISGTNVSYRALFAIARGAKCLKELEMQAMRSMDDRVLCIIAENCRELSCIDVNGCTHVTDKGLQALARRCPLREIYIRGTGATDATLYSLARFCPNLEFISFQDYTRRPGFSKTAIDHVQKSCLQRVLC